MPDLLSELLSAPDAASQAVVIDLWPVDAIDEGQLTVLKLKAAEILRVDVQKSLVLGEMILRAADRTGEALHRALGLIVVANAYSLGGLGRGSEAVTLYDEASAIYRAAGRAADEAGAQIAKILALMELGRHEEAFAAGQWAEGVLASWGEWLRLGKLIANLGNLHYRQGETAQALAMFDRARENYLKLPNDLSARQALGRLEHNRSVMLRDLGRLDEAIRTANTALEILEETGQTAETARCNLNLAIAYGILGRYNDALALLGESFDFFMRDGRSRDAAMVRIYTAQVLLVLQRFDDVLKLSNEAEELFARCGEEFYVAEAELNQATAYSGLGRDEEALAVLTAARRRFEVAGNRTWAAMTDLATASALRSLGRCEESLDLALRCASAFSAGGLPVEEAQSNLSAARTALQLGRGDEAERLLAAAERTAVARDLPSLLHRCHHGAALLSEQRGDFEVALSQAEVAMNELERLRASLMIEHRAEFLEDKASVYGDAVALALQLGRPARALAHAERARSRALIEMLDFRLRLGLRAASPGDVRLVDELLRLRGERDEIYRKWAGERGFAVRSWTSPGEEQRKTQAQILAIERRITELWRELLVRNASYAGDASLWQPGGAPLSLALPDGAALVEYTVARGDLLAFVVVDEEVRWVRLNMKLAEVERLLGLLQVNLRTVASQGRGVASRLLPNARGLLASLHDGLIAPVCELGGRPLFEAGQLLIVPYGPLHYLPFHALHDGQQYLATRRQVSYLPTLGLLPRLRARVHADGPAICLGFSGDSGLCHAVAEAEEVAGLLRGRAFVEDAAMSEVLRSDARHAPVVHLATHAEFRSDNPLFSGLRLADTWLTTLDIFGLELDASLVTLSGCHTGRSVIGGGEELLGLSRAFFAAGASSLLLSLWAVEDGSSAEFMRLYYKALVGGETKAGALQAAQQEFIGDERYAHPYYWAPFALMGDTGVL